MAGIAGAQDYVPQKRKVIWGCKKCGAKQYRYCQYPDACPHVKPHEREAILELRPDFARKGELS